MTSSLRGMPGRSNRFPPIRARRHIPWRRCTCLARCKRPRRLPRAASALGTPSPSSLPSHRHTERWEESEWRVDERVRGESVGERRERDGRVVERVTSSGGGAGRRAVRHYSRRCVWAGRARTHARESRLARAGPIKARALVRALVGAAADVAVEAAPSGRAVTSAIVARAVRRAAGGACERRAVEPGVAGLALALEIDAGAVARAIARAAARAAIVALPARAAHTLARTAHAVVVALVGAGSERAVGATPTWVAVACRIVAEAIVAAVARADTCARCERRRRQALSANEPIIGARDASEAGRRGARRRWEREGSQRADVLWQWRWWPRTKRAVVVRVAGEAAALAIDTLSVPRTAVRTAAVRTDAQRGRVVAGLDWQRLGRQKL